MGPVHLCAIRHYVANAPVFKLQDPSIFLELIVNKFIKQFLMYLPHVNRHVARVRNLQSEKINAELKVKSLESVLRKSRSPGLSNMEGDCLTERLLAHPALYPLPHVKLGNSFAVTSADRLEVSRRLLAAYHKAIEDEAISPMKREGEDLWTSLIRNELPDLMQAIEKNDAKGLSDFLLHFGESFVWFGGITTCIDGYNRNLRSEHIALTYYDKLICLAEYLGLIRFESPESGPWGENLQLDVNKILEMVEQSLGIDIVPPLGAVYTDGLESNKGLFHYRHINSLYSAVRLKELVDFNQPCLEFGGGLGITALYASRMGLKNYTMLDLPITCLLAGNYLLNSMGLDAVSLYGEARSDNKIKLLPYWECLNLPAKYFHTTLNQDSFPEIADNLLQEYLLQIKRITVKNFLSINHECDYPRTVNNFVNRASGYKKIYRSKYWIREGYIEELWRIE